MAENDFTSKKKASKGYFEGWQPNHPMHRNKQASLSIVNKLENIPALHNIRCYNHKRKMIIKEATNL
jgi:hypothetical protein